MKKNKYEIIPHDALNWRIDKHITVTDKTTGEKKPDTKVIGYYHHFESAIRAYYEILLREKWSGQDDITAIVESALKQIQATRPAIDLDPIGEFVDRIENLNTALQMPFPDETHVEALRESLPELRNDLKAAYISCGGEDVWE